MDLGCCRLDLGPGRSDQDGAGGHGQRRPSRRRVFIDSILVEVLGGVRQSDDSLTWSGHSTGFPEFVSMDIWAPASRIQAPSTDARRSTTSGRSDARSRVSPTSVERS